MKLTSKFSIRSIGESISSGFKKAYDTSPKDVIDFSTEGIRTRLEARKEKKRRSRVLKALKTVQDNMTAEDLSEIAVESLNNAGINTEEQ